MSLFEASHSHTSGVYIFAYVIATHMQFVNLIILYEEIIITIPFLWKEKFLFYLVFFFLVLKSWFSCFLNHSLVNRTLWICFVNFIIYFILSLSFSPLSFLFLFTFLLLFPDFPPLPFFLLAIFVFLLFLHLSYQIILRGA